MVCRAYNNPCCGRLNCGGKLIRGRWCLETCFIFVLFVHFSMAADCWVGASFSCEDAFPSAVLAAFRHCAAHAQEFRHSLTSEGIHLGASVVDSRDVLLFCAACLQHRWWDHVWYYRQCVRRVCRGRRWQRRDSWRSDARLPTGFGDDIVEYFTEISSPQEQSFNQRFL